MINIENGFGYWGGGGVHTLEISGVSTRPAVGRWDGLDNG